MSQICTCGLPVGLGAPMVCVCGREHLYVGGQPMSQLTLQELQDASVMYARRREDWPSMRLYYERALDLIFRELSLRLENQKTL